MPSFSQRPESPKKGRIIKSAYDSESFESDGSIHVEGLVGSATISPSGRDIALASYVFANLNDSHCIILDKTNSVYVDQRDWPSLTWTLHTTHRGD